MLNKNKNAIVPKTKIFSELNTRPKYFQSLKLGGNILLCYLFKCAPSPSSDARCLSLLPSSSVLPPSLTLPTPLGCACHLRGRHLCCYVSSQLCPPAFQPVVRSCPSLCSSPVASWPRSQPALLPAMLILRLPP